MKSLYMVTLLLLSSLAFAESSSEMIIVKSDVPLEKEEQKEIADKLLNIYGRIGPFLEVEGRVGIVREGRHKLSGSVGTTVGLAIYEDGAFPTAGYAGLNYHYQLDDGGEVTLGLSRGRFVSNKHIANNISNDDGDFNTLNASIGDSEFVFGVKVFKEASSKNGEGGDIVPMVYFEKELY